MPLGSNFIHKNGRKCSNPLSSPYDLWHNWATSLYVPQSRGLQWSRPRQYTHKVVMILTLCYYWRNIITWQSTWFVLGLGFRKGPTKSSMLLLGLFVLLIWWIMLSFIDMTSITLLNVQLLFPGLLKYNSEMLGKRCRWVFVWVFVMKISIAITWYFILSLSALSFWSRTSGPSPSPDAFGSTSLLTDSFHPCWR